VAVNRKRANGRYLKLDVSAGNGSGTGDLYLSGDPGAVGKIPWVALTDEDASGLATVDTKGVYSLAVTGVDGSGNSAVAVGDLLYWDNTAGQINKKSTMVPFGHALQAVTSGATTTILVRLQVGAA
jgi:predicted RecA/RadA family phage recombinase